MLTCFIKFGRIDPSCFDLPNNFQSPVIHHNIRRNNLKSSKEIVYLIRNKINLKCYVGETVNRFFQRYTYRPWWKGHHNDLLKRDISKYGIKNFEILILEKNISDYETRLNLEEFYALKYNAYFPYGYNFLKCGLLNNERSKFVREKMSKSYERRITRIIRLKKISDNSIIEIKNLSKFCRINDLNRGNILEMLKNSHGFNFESQGFCLPETTNEQLLSLKYRQDRIRNYHISKNGLNLIIFNLTRFCKKYGLNRKGMRRTITHPGKTHRDWKTQGNFKSKYSNIIFSYISSLITKIFFSTQTSAICLNSFSV